MSILLVQSTSKDAGTVTSTTMAMPQNVTAGNTMFFDDRLGANLIVTTVSDNLNGTWDVEGHSVDPNIEIEYDPYLWRQGKDAQLEEAIAHSSRMRHTQIRSVYLHSFGVPNEARNMTGRKG